MKSRQVKHTGEYSRLEGERNREQQIKGEIEKQHWLKTEMVLIKMAVNEIKHLSIFGDGNQQNK